jgi:hypothetical protein
MAKRIHTPAKVLTLLAALLVLPGAAAHATSLKDLQVGIRGIDFLTTPPRGQTSVAIILDTQNRDSQLDARAIAAWLTSSIHGTKAELIPTLVDIRDLDTAPPAKVAIIASGLDSSFGRILAYAQKNATLTITADLACVRNGACVLGVTTDPTVEVVLSRQASAACGVDFLRAFRMMVKEY